MQEIGSEFEAVIGIEKTGSEYAQGLVFTNRHAFDSTTGTQQAFHIQSFIPKTPRTQSHVNSHNGDIALT